MYTCIKDPVSGRNLYADILIRLSGEMHTINGMKTGDVVTEDEFADTIVRELRGVKISDHILLTTVLNDAFNISVDTCPELVLATEQRMQGVVV